MKNILRKSGFYFGFVVNIGYVNRYFVFKIDCK